MELSISPVEKSANLVDQVVHQLRSAILGGDLPIGQPIPAEAALAEQLQVSRTVVREAMQTMRGMGIVEIRRGKPARVKRPDVRDAADSLQFYLGSQGGSLLDQLEVRAPVECQIAELAAQRITREQLDGLREALDELRKARTRPEVIDADVRFHARLADATGNPLFATLLAAVAELMRISIAATNPGPARIVTLELHEAIFDAVEAGDPLAARQAMQAHMDEAARYLREQGVK